MNRIRVAVTGPSGDVGHGIVCGLRESVLPIFLLGLDFMEVYAAQLHCDASIKMPKVDSQCYISCLIEVVKTNRIQYLFCGIDSEVLLLAQNKELIQQTTGCRVIVAAKELVAICVDKLLTAKWLTSLQIATPATWDVSELKDLARTNKINLPLILKPRTGRSSVGVKVISTQQELDSALDAADSSVCFQEYLPGAEYTCGLIFDANECLKDWVISRRELAGGRTVVAEFCNEPAITQLIESFGGKVSATGALNIQLRFDADGVPKIFEINPRISGSTLMRLNAGYNDPARLLENYVSSTPIVKTRPLKIRVVREWSTISAPIEVGMKALPAAIDTLVFDCGGTLLRLQPSVEAICHRVLGEMGHKVPLQKVEEAYRIVDFAIKRQSSREHGDADRSHFYKTFNQLLAKAMGIGVHAERFHTALFHACKPGSMHWTPLPNVMECLEQLTSQFRLLILANWDCNLRTLLKKNGLDGYFDDILDSQSIGAEKPSPIVFTHLITQCKVTPSCTAYVGNEFEADITGSRNMGFTPVLLDHRLSYSPGVDCSYFTTWKAMTNWLLGRTSSLAVG
ncbi:MAG: ATP-grasp domain-containing protein [Planctomycetaceae bacterium]|nr:ATP-grasp domain-containing protein [Planctomycetaceae bacterium]